MQSSIDTRSGTATASLTGRLTFNDQQAFRDLLTGMSQSGAKAWVLDLTRLEFIDSAGLGLLLLLRQAAAKEDAQASLRVAPDGQVRKLMDAARFGQMFSIQG